jgi:hypothetical protein
VDAFQKQCIDVLNRFADDRLLADSGATLWEHLDTGGMMLTSRDAGAAFAAAFAADPNWGNHPRAAELRSLAIKAFDRWLDILVRSCKQDGSAWSFSTTCLAACYELLGPHATATRRKRWLKAITLCAECNKALLLSKKAAWGKPGPYTGCGPNHLFVTGAALYRLGRLLKRPEIARVGRDTVRGMCGIQTDEGYFAETIGPGPAVGYHQVSLHGLCDYYAASGDQTRLPAIRRGIRFIERASYPDVTSMRALDERNREGRRPGQVGMGTGTYGLAFDHTPAGRRFAQITLDRIAEAQKKSPESIGWYAASIIALSATAHTPGRAAKSLSCERPAYVEHFDGVAGVVRRDGWCVALSGYIGSNRPGSPYHMDRTQQLSVFNDACGLIIGGGNDKKQLDAATFEVRETVVWYFPHVDAKAKMSGRRGTLDLDFGAGQARLTANIVSPKLLELVAGLQTNFGEQENRLNLQIPVGVGAKLKIDGQPVTLRERKTQKAWAVKKSLELVGFARIDLPRGAAAEFCWPHLPWNVYDHKTFHAGINGAVGFLRLPLTGHDITERKVRVHLLT